MKRPQNRQSNNQRLDRDLAAMYGELTGLFHNLVVSAGLDPRADFCRRDLREMQFTGADLRNFDFSYSDLRGTFLRSAAKLDSSTILEGAQLDSDDLNWLLTHNRPSNGTPDINPMTDPPSPGKPDIRHVVVIMLERRSFDCMLGLLYPNRADFDGLKVGMANSWHQAGLPPRRIQVWTDPALTATSLCIPDPDPGGSFRDIFMQIRGLTDDGNPSPGPPSMSGFVDNYMRKHAPRLEPDPDSVMHYFTPEQVPVISRLARAFGVSDRWHSSAPCPAWPNRFFVHTGTAGGFVNNSPGHFPYLMHTVFGRLSAIGKDWRIYFHDIPQSAALADLWNDVPRHFREFDTDFARDAAAGTLPDYSFIEPRYFADPFLNRLPNDEHPPHNVAYGEELIANVYNAVRFGPGWEQTLLVITYDEHGGCYDHVVPPMATPPDNRRPDVPDAYDFGTFGVRVPAVIVSPYVRAGSIIRPPGATPFDHTSIISTLRSLFNIGPLTARDAAAPDLLGSLGDQPLNNPPNRIVAPAVPPAPQQVARACAKPLSDLQQSLSTAALQLPTLGANLAVHIQRLASAAGSVGNYNSVAAAVADIRSSMKAFLGKV
jgi:phospholipase C